MLENHFRANKWWWWRTSTQ